MVSSTSDPFMSPTSRPTSARKQTAPSQCAICGQHSHNTNNCPSTAEVLNHTRAARSDQQSLCAHCASPLHKTTACPQISEVFARQAFRLHELEPFARCVLKTGIPRDAPCCGKHSQMDFAYLTVTLGRTLQDRALNPMCPNCVAVRQQQLKLDIDVEFRSSIDSCNCAAFVFDNNVCQWCALEELQLQQTAYEGLHHKMLRHYDSQQLIPYLACVCGAIPMGTPSDAAPPGPMTREVMRLCSSCAGVVNVPLHHIDGTHHLACIPGRPSKAILLSDGLVGADVEGEPLGTGTDDICDGHPVRTVAQKIIAIKRKDSAVSISDVVAADGSPSTPGQKQMRPQASTGMAAQSQGSGSMPMPSQASGEAAMPSQLSKGMIDQSRNSGGSASRSRLSGGTGEYQQKQAPVTMMVPSTPEHWDMDEISATVQPGRGFNSRTHTCRVILRTPTLS